MAPRAGRRGKRDRGRQLRRGVFLLPSLLTAGGMLCGFYSLVATLRQDFVVAAVAIILANVFDVVDGRVARVTKSTTEFGSEFDSLADLVTFGVAPSLLAYHWALRPFGTVGWLAAALYVICGALRLARFNVQKTTVEKRYFVGLPIPAGAEMIASTVLLYFYLVGSDPDVHRHPVVLVMVYALAGLMVSNIRYLSFKEIDFHSRQPFGLLVAAIVMISIFIAEPQVFLFTGFLLYTSSGPLAASRRWLGAWKAARKHPSDLTVEKDSSSVER